MPTQIFSKITEYSILDRSLPFDISSNLEVNGKKVIFLTKQELNPSKPCFLFHTLSIENSKAFARYYLDFTINGVKNIIPITIDFEKNN